jgi:UDP-glucuronate decarboxylase
VRETLKNYAEIVFNLACPASPAHYSSDPHSLTTSVLGAMRRVDHARVRNCSIVHASISSWD